jgi:hypothetical protein
MGKTIDIVLHTDQKRYAAWRAAAKRCNMTLNDWLMMGITLSDHLSLVEGTATLPANGTQMDPLLAEGIRRAAIGKPWEHQAMLLIGAPALRPNPHNADAPPEPLAVVVPSGRDAAYELLTRYGFPHDPPKTMSTMYMSIAGHNCTWIETVILLHMHHTAGSEWRESPAPEFGELCGTSATHAANSINRLIFLGRLEEANDTRYGGRPRVLRVAPHIAAAINRGELHRIQPAKKRPARAERAKQKPPIHLAGLDPDVQAARELVPEDHPMRKALVRRIVAERKELRAAGHLVDE